MSYTPTIGLEIHAELKTATKMFCRSKNASLGERPNTNICPVCMAHPGTLPVINKEAVKHVLKVGLAMGGTLADVTEFDRKNYFYPDIPKGYQISQYKYPLISGGSLTGIAITRIHLEEDTARSSHHGTHSLVDYNRAGVPLMELVTEPVIHTAQEASTFARELQLLLRHLGASDANMERGEMRVEANISISKDDTLGTKVEVKNLNSFKAVEKAIAYEIARHERVLEEGGEIAQETRGWNDEKGETFSQRSKESAHDYRYFPDPDLPKLSISEIPEFKSDVLREEFGELPWQRRLRYTDTLGLPADTAEIFVRDSVLGELFDSVARTIGDDKKGITLAANYIASDLVALMKDDTPEVLRMTPESIAELVGMITAGDISSRGAKDTLAIMYREGGSAREVAERENLLQKSDEGELKAIVEGIIAEHALVAEEYRGGKESSIQFFIGQGMKATKGAANPGVLKKLFENALR